MRYAHLHLFEREWALVEPVFARRRRKGGRPANDRKLLEAMLYVAWSRTPWRQLPEGFGNPNSVSRAFTRWCEDGTVDRLLAWCAIPRSDEKTRDEALNLGHRLAALRELTKRYVRGSRRKFVRVPDRFSAEPIA